MLIHRMIKDYSNWQKAIFLKYKFPNIHLFIIASKVYNKYQGPKIVAPFHLLFALKSLDDFKI